MSIVRWSVTCPSYGGASHVDRTVERHMSIVRWSIPCPSYGGASHVHRRYYLALPESILFGSSRRLNGTKPLDVTCDGHSISSNSCVKYLGVELDQSLSGSHIADNIIKKSNAKLKFLYRQARHLNVDTKKLLTSALIQCHFDYASTSWYSGLTKRLQNRLQTTQNKVIRFLLSAPPRTHIGFEEFKAVGMLPVEVRVNQLKVNYIHDMIYGNAPRYLTSSISIPNSRHNTRSGPMSLVIPAVKSFGHSSFRYTSVTAWNELPSDIRTTSVKSVFKSKVKSFLFNKFYQESQNPFIYL